MARFTLFFSFQLTGLFSLRQSDRILHFIITKPTGTKELFKINGHDHNISISLQLGMYFKCMNTIFL